MRISQNFVLDEFTKTSTKLSNVPSADAVRNIVQLVTSIMQPLRDKYGKPILITSGYRSPDVNKAVGGTNFSLHKNGLACDFTAQVPYPKSFMAADEVAKLRSRENKRLFEMIQEMKLPYYELIEYNDYRWIHVSFNRLYPSKTPQHTLKYSDLKINVSK